MLLPRRTGRLAGDALSPAQRIPAKGPVRDRERSGHPQHDPILQGDRHPSRIPVLGYEERSTLPRDGAAAACEVWLLIQRHLKRDPSTRAVIDWLRSCFVRGRTTAAPQPGTNVLS